MCGRESRTSTQPLPTLREDALNAHLIAGTATAVAVIALAREAWIAHRGRRRMTHLRAWHRSHRTSPHPGDWGGQ